MRSRPLLLVLPWALSACAPGEGEMREAADPVPVRIGRVEARAEPDRLTLAGELLSIRRIEVASKIAGRIVEIPLLEGSKVRRGDLLVRLDAPEIESGVAQTRAAEAAARLELEVARRQAERYRRLAAADVVTPRDLELAELQAAGALSAYEGARAAAVAGLANVGYAAIRADGPGVVVRRLAREGDLATPGRPLLVLEDEDAKEVRITLPSPFPWRVRAGDRVEIGMPEGTAPSSAVVDRVTPGADRHTVEAFLRVPLRLDVPTGTFLDVTLLAPETTTALRVPAEALLHRGPLVGCFAVKNDRAQLRWIRMSADGRVLAGVAAGDSIILAPSADLLDGAPVTVAP